MTEDGCIISRQLRELWRIVKVRALRVGIEMRERPDDGSSDVASGCSQRCTERLRRS